jgi:hypothetical protein
MDEQLTAILQRLIAEADRIRSSAPQGAAFLDAVTSAAASGGGALQTPPNPKAAARLAHEIPIQESLGHKESVKLLKAAMVAAAAGRPSDFGILSTMSLEEIRTALSQLSQSSVEDVHSMALRDIHEMKQSAAKGHQLTSSPIMKVSGQRLSEIDALCREFGSSVTYSA